MSNKPIETRDDALKSEALKSAKSLVTDNNILNTSSKYKQPQNEITIDTSNLIVTDNNVLNTSSTYEQPQDKITIDTSNLEESIKHNSDFTQITQKQLTNSTDIFGTSLSTTPTINLEATPITNLSMLNKIFKTDCICVFGRPSSIHKATNFANETATLAQGKPPVYICNFPEGKYIRAINGENTHLINLHSSVAVINNSDGTLSVIPLKNSTQPNMALENFKNPDKYALFTLNGWNGIKITNY